MKSVLLTAALLFNFAAGAATNSEVLNRVAVGVMTQTYLDMTAGGADLQAKVQQLANSRTQENLAAAQESWRQMRKYWERSEAFLFGPVESLNIDPSIDTWPVNRLDLDGVLASGRTLDVAFVRNLNVSLQGYHVIEYLLFGNGINSNVKPIANLTGREVEYLLSTSALLAENAALLARAWTTNANPDDPSVPGFAQLLANPSLRNPSYQSEQAVLGEFVRGMIAIIEEVGTGKLAGPLGGSLDAAAPDQVESPYSWNSLTDFTDNIRSALNVFTGEYNDTHGPGLRDVIAASNPALAVKVEARLRQAIVNIQAIAGAEKLDFRQAILNQGGRVRTQVAIDDLVDLQNFLQNEVLPIVEQ